MPPSGASGRLSGLSILIVEDELLLAMEYRAILEQEGCDILGPAPNERKALNLLDKRRPDLAILDLNLQGNLPKTLADTLADIGVPFIIVTGYAKKYRTEQPFAEAPRLEKPVNARELVGTLERLAPE